MVLCNTKYFPYRYVSSPDSYLVSSSQTTILECLTANATIFQHHDLYKYIFHPFNNDRSLRGKETVRTLVTQHLGRVIPLRMPTSQTKLINDHQNNITNTRKNFICAKNYTIHHRNNTKKGTNYAFFMSCCFLVNQRTVSMQDTINMKGARELMNHISFWSNPLPT